MNTKWQDLGISRATYYRRLKDGKPMIVSARRVSTINPIWKYVDIEWVYRTCSSMSRSNYELYDYLLDYCYTLDLSIAINPKSYITARLRNRIRDFIRFRKLRE
jgi:hypothetical protein